MKAKRDHADPRRRAPRLPRSRASLAHCLASFATLTTLSSEHSIIRTRKDTRLSLDPGRVEGHGLRLSLLAMSLSNGATHIWFAGVRVVVPIMRSVAMDGDY